MCPQFSINYCMHVLMHNRSLRPRLELPTLFVGVKDRVEMNLQVYERPSLCAVKMATNLSLTVRVQRPKLILLFRIADLKIHESIMHTLGVPQLSNSQ